MPAKIRKKEVPPYAVICDTTMLWHDDKGPACNPDFEKFWEACSSDYNLKLYLPEIVLGELMFQQSTSAAKSLANAEEHLKKIASITGKAHHARSDYEKIKKAVFKKFMLWLKHKKGEILELPVKMVDWVQLANKAVWHLPPFTLDTKNPDLEKGFRDALIQETVCCFVKSNASRNVVFLCQDKLLRETTSLLLASSKNFLAYENFSDFESYLRLTKETFTKEFIAEIQVRAKEKFFSEKVDEDSFYYEAKIQEKIVAQYGSYLTDIEKSKKLSSLTHDLISAWNPVELPFSYWIQNPEFISIQNNHRYFWRSVVRYIKLYRRQPIQSPMLKYFPNIPPEKILFLPFHITWSAKVKADARFYDMKLEKIEMVGNDFREPTQEEIVAYKLRPEVVEEDL